MTQVDPKDEKILAYVVERNVPVTIKQVMKALVISETHAKRALEFFVSAGLAEIKKQGSIKFYKVKS